MLGWSAVPALFIALLLQGIPFQFGGLLSLGVNTTVMGTAALAGSGVYRVILPRIPAKLGFLPAFAAGFTAVLTGTVLVCAALFFSDMELGATAALLFAANLPLAAVEGVISAFTVAFLSKTAPQYVS